MNNKQEPCWGAAGERREEGLFRSETSGGRRHAATGSAGVRHTCSPGRRLSLRKLMARERERDVKAEGKHKRWERERERESDRE